MAQPLLASRNIAAVAVIVKVATTCCEDRVLDRENEEVWKKNLSRLIKGREKGFWW